MLRIRLEFGMKAGSGRQVGIQLTLREGARPPEEAGIPRNSLLFLRLLFMF